MAELGCIEPVRRGAQLLEDANAALVGKGAVERGVELGSRHFHDAGRVAQACARAGRRESVESRDAFADQAGLPPAT